MSEETHLHHSSPASGGSAANLLPYSILIAALILGGSMVWSANTLNTGLAHLNVAVPTTGNGNTIPTVTDPGTQTPPTPTTIDVQGLVGSSATLGSATAPVTIVEFSDFQCPFCGRFYGDAYNQIKTDYVDTGKVKIVFKNFPLSFHPYAQKGAESAQCAMKQGKFWEMHDKLFSTQDALTAHFQTESDPAKALAAVIVDIKADAKALGLNETQFNSCLDNGDTAAAVQAEYTEGTNIGVSGTPSFVIGSGANGSPLVGALPFASFKSAIDAALAKAAN